MKITNCSLVCMYAEGPIGECHCVCRGATHGLMAAPSPVKVECSPSVAARCKAGVEGGECHCACGGANHGLYRSVEHFDGIKITGMGAMIH